MARGHGALGLAMSCAVAGAMLSPSASFARNQSRSFPHVDEHRKQLVVPASLTFLLFNAADMTEESVTAMRSELDRMLSDAAIELTVVSCDGPPCEPPHQDHAIVRVVVWNREPEEFGLRATVLGMTEVGQMPPGAIVFQSVVLSRLGITGDVDGSLSANAVGVAVARIILHETAHALAPGLPHTGVGLMSGYQDRVSLTRTGATLTPGEAQAIREGIRAHRRLLAMNAGTVSQ